MSNRLFSDGIRHVQSPVRPTEPRRRKRSRCSGVLNGLLLFLMASALCGWVANKCIAAHVAELKFGQHEAEWHEAVAPHGTPEGGRGPSDPNEDPDTTDRDIALITGSIIKAAVPIGLIGCVFIGIIILAVLIVAAGALRRCGDSKWDNYARSNGERSNDR